MAFQQHYRTELRSTICGSRKHIWSLMQGDCYESSQRVENSGSQINTSTYDLNIKFT